MKKIIINESQLIKLISGSINQTINERKQDILSESSTNIVYHYCALNSLVKMIKSDSLYFSPQEKEYSDGYNYMSTTRMRNSKQGFAYMQTFDNDGGGTFHYQQNPYLLIRIELDANKLQHLQYNYRKNHHTIKAKPFDYMYALNKADGEPNPLSGKHELMQGVNQGCQNDDYNYYMRQPYSQAEERFLSKKTNVKGFKDCAKRIDFCLMNIFNIDIIQEYNEAKIILEALKLIRQLWLNNEWENKVFAYLDNQDSFNIQASKSLLNNHDVTQLITQFEEILK